MTSDFSLASASSLVVGSAGSMKAKVSADGKRVTISHHRADGWYTGTFAISNHKQLKGFFSPARAIAHALANHANKSPRTLQKIASAIAELGIERLGSMRLWEVVEFTMGLLDIPRERCDGGTILSVIVTEDDDPHGQQGFDVLFTGEDFEYADFFVSGSIPAKPKKRDDADLAMWHIMRAVSFFAGADVRQRHALANELMGEWNGTRSVSRIEKLADVRRTAYTADATTGKVPTMTQPTLKAIRDDAGEAAWRTAGSQFVKLARDPLVGLLSRHLSPGDDAMRGRIAAFLETEVGTALLTAVLSAGLSALPSTKAGDIPEKLAHELRVKSMANTGDLVADLLMGPMRQVVSLYLQGDLPSVPAAGLPLGKATPVSSEQRESVGVAR